MPIIPENLGKIEEEDIVLTSYPRSGNTWTRRLIYEAVLRSRPDVPAPEHVDRLVPDLHMHDADGEAQRTYDLPHRILKSHNIRDLPSARIVYVVREPGDALVSYFHFEGRDLPEGTVRKESIDEYAFRMAKSWADHVSLGMERYYANPDRVLIVTYGMLHDDTAGVLRRIAHFCGLQISTDALAESVKRNQFETLQRTAKPSRPNASVRKFFRRGIRGSARDELKATTNRWIEATTGRFYREAEALAAMAFYNEVYHGVLAKARSR